MSDRPHLLRPDIIKMLTPLTEIEPPPMSALEATTYVDLRVTLTMAEDAKTILFSTEQALALAPALERFAEDLTEYRLPFPYVILQFTQPIPEARLFDAEITAGMKAMGIKEDQLLALLLGQEDENGKLVNGAAAWFATGSVNRVVWTNDARAHLRILPFAGQASVEEIRNKQTLRNLAIACIAYINCENIGLEKQAVPEKVNRKRLREGKKVLEDYYTCTLRTAKGEANLTGAGSSHGFRYDVRGHFRRLPDGRLTWVRAHQRGLEHELYKPKVWKAD